MLDTDTKRRIDTARDILVGKVPDPKSQVEQITIALIYKFMDDMDAESEEFGGKRKFFAKEFTRYGWAKLMRSGLGGHETLNLYAEAIANMPQNPGIPLLFREIFKNAYLPYRDPETVRAFLKVIDEFNYDHSERLGDAFEYLLSVLGSQGDAGQFRTPRHIIDFMVEIIDPKKTETVLDPACGTAGFLISSYKHIRKVNTDKKGHSTLTPDEKGRLAKNFKGYDISPDMVRLSLVNLYLHGFADPHIAEYDTLTSQDRWNEYADVILANPPFMSPKGGIKPHNRFSVESKRSEVLFVDYMAEHLTPNGRAGIIVPEGIIFQSQTAHTQLRKMLVEDYLVAVVSLPAGVFNPYAGVKTSILILDKSLAKKTSAIAFFKVENDGFGLGAQRREIEKNDLPATAEALKTWLKSLQSPKSTPSTKSTSSTSSTSLTPNALIVEKTKIAANGEYNLSGERYREEIVKISKFTFIKLGDLCRFIDYRGKTPTKTEKGIPLITAKNVREGYINPEPREFISEGDYKPWMTRGIPQKGDVLFTMEAPLGNVAVISMSEKFALAQRIVALCPNRAVLCGNFLKELLLSKPIQDKIKAHQTGSTVYGIKARTLKEITIPVPTLEVQKEMVAEIEAYQKVIDGARAVLDNYRPHIPIHPDWPVKDLVEIANKITDGTHITPSYMNSGIPFLRVTDITESNDSKRFISREEHRELIKHCHPQKGDVLYSKNGTIGVAKLVDWDWEFSIFVSLALIKPRREIVDATYLTCFLNSDTAYAQATARSKSGTVTNLHLVEIKTIRVPLPPLATQRAIVAEIEAEQALVAANRELIARFEKKIQATLARVWGKEKPIQSKK